MQRAESVHGGVQAVAAAALLCLGAGLVWTVVDLPLESTGLAPMVQSRLEESGVSSPVTAVLLNFRGYDTLLEVVVLTMALTSVWSLRAPSKRLAGAPGAALTAAVSLLTPLMIVVGGYLLWKGTSQPGGAFHAGAVIAAAGVLLLLSEMPALRVRRQWLVRAGAASGVAVFVGVGLGCLAAGMRFLEYPPGWSKPLIVVVEAASSVSIALILAGVFASNPRVLTRGYDQPNEGA